MGDRRNGHGIGRRQHRCQGKAGGQWHLRQQPVDEMPRPENGEEHQGEGEQQDRCTQLAKLPLGHTPAVDEQQRRNEQQQKQLGIEPYMQTQRGNRQQRADQNLQQRQWQGNELGSNTGATDHQQHGQNGVEQLHGAKPAGTSGRLRF